MCWYLDAAHQVRRRPPGGSPHSVQGAVGRFGGCRAVQGADGARTGRRAGGRWSPSGPAALVRRAGLSWSAPISFLPTPAISWRCSSPETYDLQRIDNELRIARLAGFNTVRVFLHDQLWAQGHFGFQNRLPQFVALASSHGIKPLFVLFDSCWDPFSPIGPSAQAPARNTQLGVGPEPGCAASGRPAGTAGPCVTCRRGVITQFRHDERVSGMGPVERARQSRGHGTGGGNGRFQGGPGRRPLAAGIRLGPAQSNRGAAADQRCLGRPSGLTPLKRSAMARIQLLDHSDVVTFHSYDDPVGFEARIGELALSMGRPILGAPSTWREARAAP